MIKTSENRPLGPALRPTSVDARKSAADFRIIDMTGRTVSIRWQDGRRQEVTRRELEKLEKEYSWACDF